jgi:hypothetical protein
MPKEPRINSFITERVTAPGVTEKEAFGYYRRMEKPTLDAVGEHVTQLGCSLSCSKLNKWAAKGHWSARLDPSAAISVVDPATAVGELARLGREAPEPVIRGLAHKLLYRLAVAIHDLEIRDIADFARSQDLAAELIQPRSPAGSDADKSPRQSITFAPFVIAERE